ncbi:MAG: hypothetical protein R2776_02875 [Flavobacteriaceae bacterium]
MKHLILTLILIFSSLKGYSCECYCPDDCSFSVISTKSKFVALVKIISFDDFLNDEILGYDGKMPYSMTVEIIKKYKGSESRNRIKIWGDNGMLCRPYIANFKIGEYYLIAPSILGEFAMEVENELDYDFFSCHTDYLKVDMEELIAIGEYSKSKNEIKLSDFEIDIKK